MKQTPVRHTDKAELGEPQDARPTGQSQVINRTLGLLFEVVRAGHPISPAELATRLDIPRPSVYRLAGTLEAEGLLLSTGKGLVPTPRFFLLSSGGEATATLSDVAEPYVGDVADVTGETAGVHVRVGTLRRCISSVEGSRSIRWVHRAGYTAPIFAGANGYVLMAALSEDELDSLFTSIQSQDTGAASSLDPALVRDRIQKMRDQGWYMSIEEVEQGAASLAVPIRSASSIIGSLNLYTPVSRAEQLCEAIPHLRSAATKISLTWERVHQA